MRDDVKTFYGGASDFDTCLQNNPNNTCDRCKDEYSGLNFWYEKLEDDYRGNVCLDVTAAMVDFRDKWFGLGCISPLAYDVIVIAIGCGVIIACLLMYIISRRFARMHRPGFLTRKYTCCEEEMILIFVYDSPQKSGYPCTRSLSPSTPRLTNGLTCYRGRSYHDSCICKCSFIIIIRVLRTLSSTATHRISRISVMISMQTTMNFPFGKQRIMQCRRRF